MLLLLLVVEVVHNPGNGRDVPAVDIDYRLSNFDATFQRIYDNFFHCNGTKKDKT